jgi:glycosyltransferase involved in cell wall biosynthesis
MIEFIMSLPYDPISVIIPLYNGAKFIEQALASVAGQSLPAHELIVVDDGSTDDGAALVERFAETHPLKLLRRPNGGQSAARNYGIASSTGNLIALLDQDDVWYPDHLAELVKPFGVDQPVPLGWTYSNLDEIDERGCLIKRQILDQAAPTHPKTDLLVCLRQDMFILPSASLMSRKAFDAVGRFDECLSGYEDDDLFLRLFRAGYQNIYIEKPLSQWRVYSSSSSYSPRMAKSRMIYARKLINGFPDDPTRKHYYVKDVIAPRFMKQVVVEARAALAAVDEERINRCLDDLGFLDKFLNIDGENGLARREPLITAVIPLFNGEDFIEEAIASILAQTLKADEIIVVDDGSTDSGPDIVLRLAKTAVIRLIRKQNGGQSSARNHGVAHAHGDLIAFLDQDDIWYPNHLSELVKPHLAERSVQLGWSYSNLDEINRDGRVISRGFLDTLEAKHPKRSVSSCLVQDMFILPSASLVSRRAFQCVGGFDEGLSGYEDDDLFLRMFYAGFESVYLPQSLSKWRIYDTSCSYTSRMAVSRGIYARKLIAQFPNQPAVSRYYVRDLIAPRFFRIMAMELRKAVLTGTREQQIAALMNLAFIVGHLRVGWRLPLRLCVLPALRLPPLARLIMRYRIPISNVLQRILKSAQSGSGAGRIWQP